jgi:hypothetical protein
MRKRLKLHEAAPLGFRPRPRPASNAIFERALDNLVQAKTNVVVIPAPSLANSPSMELGPDEFDSISLRCA